MILVLFFGSPAASAAILIALLTGSLKPSGTAITALTADGTKFGQGIDGHLPRYTAIDS